MLIIQGTEFNYMENIKHFPNRGKKKKNQEKQEMSLSSAFNAPTVPSAEAPKKCWISAPAPNTANQASLLWDRFCLKLNPLQKPNSAKFLQDERVTYALQHCTQRAFCSEMATTNFED